MSLFLAKERVGSLKKGAPRALASGERLLSNKVRDTGCFQDSRVAVRLEQDMKPPQLFAMAFLLLTCTRGAAGVAFVGSHIRNHCIFFVEQIP